MNMESIERLALWVAGFLVGYAFGQNRWLW